MKKHIAISVVCLLGILLLAACGNSGSQSLHPDADVSEISSSSAQTSAPASSAPASSVSSSSASSSAATSSSSQPPVEHSITGTVDDVAMGQVYLLAEDGRVIAFEYTNANISKWTNSKPGATITVYYTGTLNGSDTSGITVTRIEDAA